MAVHRVEEAQDRLVGQKLCSTIRHLGLWSQPLQVMIAVTLISIRILGCPSAVTPTSVQTGA
jgi:hypothetical protein